MPTPTPSNLLESIEILTLAGGAPRDGAATIVRVKRGGKIAIRPLDPKRCGDDRDEAIEDARRELDGG